MYIVPEFRVSGLTFGDLGPTFCGKSVPKS